jgi:hypothetical protein
MKRSIAVLALALATASAARAELAPVGPELQVNTYTTGGQSGPSVAMDSAGNFVVVWQSGSRVEAGLDGSLYGVSGRRFDASGGVLGPEFVVNSFTPGWQRLPVIAADGAGRFTVSWTSGTYFRPFPFQDGSALGAFVQRYDAAGAPLGPEFQANTYTTGSQSGTAVATDAAGNFVVVWMSENYQGADQDGSDSGIFAQRYDSAGGPFGPEFQVNTYTTGYQYFPSVSMDPSGGFVVAWQSGDYYNEPDGSGTGIVARRFASSGAPLGTEFQVNSYTTDDQRSPAVAVSPDGSFVIVWASGDYYGNSQDGSRTGVVGRRFDAGGVPLGADFVVNTYTTGSQDGADVAVDAEGNFVVAWQSRYTDQDGDADGIFAQHFTSTGTPDGPEFQVNTYTTSFQDGPAVAAGPGGTFVVAWQGTRFGGPSSGIFAQRFRALGPLHPLVGTKLALGDDVNATLKTLLLRAADSGITLGGGNGSADDPTLTGGRLRVRIGTSTQTYELPAANWRTIGAPGANQGYVYRDPFLFAGPVVKAKVRAGQRLRIVAKGSQLLHTLGTNPDPVTVTLQTGDLGHRYCMRFGGVTAFKPNRFFRARGAPAGCS